MLRTRTLLATVAAFAAAAALPAAATAAPPANDSYYDALVLPGSGGTHSTSNSQATYSSAEDGGSRLGTGTHSVWYRWMAPKNGRVTFTVTSGSFNPVLNVYAGDTTCCPWDSDDDSDDFKTTLDIDVLMGQQYFIAVDGETPGQHGAFTIAAAFDDTPTPPAGDAFLSPVALGNAGEYHRPMYQHFASKQAGEPVHRGKSTSASIWHTWIPLASGGTNVWSGCYTSSGFSTHSPVVAVYEGDSLNDLDEVAYTETASPVCTFAQFQAVAGRKYRIVVAAEAGPVGGATLHLDQDPVKPTVQFTYQTEFGPFSGIPFTTSSDVKKTQCAFDSGPLGACHGTKFQMVNASGGSHTLRVVATDSHGNVGEAQRSVFVDKQAPGTTITKGPGATTKDTGAAVEFTSDVPGTFECSVDGGAWKVCASPFPTPYHGHDATVKVEVRAKDGWGNIETSPAARSWVVDKVAPKVLLVGGEPSAPAGKPLTWAFTSDDAQASFECSVEYGPYAPCSSPFTLAGADRETTHHLTVRATDPAGNQSITGWRGRQTKAPTTTTTSTGTGTATTTGTRAETVRPTAPGSTRTGTTRAGTTALRLVPLRVPRTVSRKVLARRGLKVRGGCTATCRLTVELRAGRRLVVRKKVTAAGAGTIVLRARPALARTIRRLKPGRVLTVTARAPGAPARTARMRLTR